MVLLSEFGFLALSGSMPHRTVMRKIEDRDRKDFCSGQPLHSGDCGRASNLNREVQVFVLTLLPLIRVGKTHRLRFRNLRWQTHRSQALVRL